MAFHLHLIHTLWDHGPGANPRPDTNARDFHEPRLSLHWELDGDGRPYARWTRV